MMEYLSRTEPVWLFAILTVEMIVGLYTAIILTVEYFYDKKIYEQKRRRIVRTKNKVRIKADPDGQIYILEQPKNVDVSIEHGSKEE